MTACLEFANEVAAARTYLMRFAQLQLRNEAWAEDVVAETMLAALEKPHSYAGKSRLRTWLVGILKFKIIDCLRANQRTVAASIDCAAGAEFEDLLFQSDGHHRDENSDWLDPEQSLSSKQFLQIIDSCIAEMPATMGRVFMMREWLEFSTDEICEELSITPSNVWVLLHRARLRLREDLQAQWFNQKPARDSQPAESRTWREVTVRI